MIIYSTKDTPSNLDTHHSASDFREALQERILAEEKFRRMEATVRSVLDSSLDPILVCDLDGKIIDCNHAIKNVFGYDREAFLGMNVAQLLMNNTQEEGGLKITCQQIMGTTSARWCALRSNGERFPIEISVSAVEDPGPA